MLSKFKIPLYKLDPENQKKILDKSRKIETELEKISKNPN